MPMNRKLYPVNWGEIREAILARANNHCEWCGVENHAIGARDLTGIWRSQYQIDHMKSDTGFELFGDYPKIIKIVLTVAHLNHDPSDSDWLNLAALCQRCHLNYDRKQHIQNAKVTRARKRIERIAATGQQSFSEANHENL